MLKRSAGVILYTKENNEYKILLCHMGGPFWKGIDNGAWSIPKGEYKLKENAYLAAKREFKEETGFNIDDKELFYLKSKKMSSHKLVTMFYTEGYFDSSKSFSNNFKKEWPKGSGIIKEFPEMDEARWMNLSDAKQKILKGQIYFIEKIEQILKNNL